MRVNPPLVSGLLVPMTALAVALGPAVVPAPSTPPAVPLVHVDAVQLAGIGQDIYNAVTPAVQYVVGGVSYLINFVPVVGAIAAAQINIDYYQGIQPAVAATVNYAAALVQDPLDFVPITRGYVDSLVGIQYDLVSAQLRFLGFSELPPRPASGGRPGPRFAAAATRSDRSDKARTQARKIRPSASARPAVAAVDEPSVQPRGLAETRRQKSTTGRTRSAI